MRSYPEIREEASVLPGFDSEVFAAMMATSPLTPGTERSTLYARLAVMNTEVAEGLVAEAKACLEAPSPDSLVIQGIAGAARIRLLAAEHCRNLSIRWAATK
jgi:hypothetical protein